MSSTSAKERWAREMSGKARLTVRSQTGSKSLASSNAGSAK
jgi:hypothetical protein